jgi:hypothetical protein
MTPLQPQSSTYQAPQNAYRTNDQPNPKAPGLGLDRCGPGARCRRGSRSGAGSGGVGLTGLGAGTGHGGGGYAR